MLTMELRRRVDGIWDKIWASGISNPLTAIEYFSTILLLRRLSDSHRTSNDGSASDSPMAGDLLDKIQKNDLRGVAALMIELQTRFGIGASPEIGASATWRDLATLKEVIDGVWALELTDRNHDILGDLFEYLLDHLNTAGHFGQFRTPRHLIKFIVEAISPKSGETVVDPACGTGGFLIAAHEYSGDSQFCSYVGDEVDSTIARIAKTNIALHDMRTCEIHNDDSLLIRTRDADVILANPPFAGAVVAERAADFHCGTRKTELLFIELMILRLRRGGRAGVIIPTSVLTARTKSAQWIRQELLEKNNLQAVVELPNGVFRPYTDVKTAIVFWTNDRPREDVLMIRVSHDGYSLDDKREPIADNDLPQALLALAGKKADIPHLRVPIAEISNHEYNLSPSRYLKPNLDHLPPTYGVSLPESIASAQLAAKSLLEQISQLEMLIR